MINLYSSALLWIQICTIVIHVGTRVGAYELRTSYFSQNKLHSYDNQSSMVSSLVNPLERNKRALEQIYLTRDREEDADPMNYLSKLYSDIAETREGPISMIAEMTNDETPSRIADPVQIELVFHKKVPNSDNEFNISKIVELVDEDKRQRQCPCKCPPRPCGTMQGLVQAMANSTASATHSTTRTTTASPLHSTVGVSASQLHSNAQVAGIRVNVSKESTSTIKAPPYKSNVKPSGAIGTKKTDEKTKIKPNLSPIQPKMPHKKINNIGIVDSKKLPVPNRQPVQGMQRTLVPNKNMPRQQSTDKQGHARLNEIRPIKQGISLGKNQGGKFVKQASNIDQHRNNLIPLNQRSFNGLYK